MNEWKRHLVEAPEINRGMQEPSKIKKMGSPSRDEEDEEDDEDEHENDEPPLNDNADDEEPKPDEEDEEDDEDEHENDDPPLNDNADDKEPKPDEEDEEDDEEEDDDEEDESPHNDDAVKPKPDDEDSRETQEQNDEDEEATGDKEDHQEAKEKNDEVEQGAKGLDDEPSEPLSTKIQYYNNQGHKDVRSFMFSASNVLELEEKPEKLDDNLWDLYSLSEMQIHAWKCREAQKDVITDLKDFTDKEEFTGLMSRLHFWEKRCETLGSPNKSITDFVIWPKKSNHGSMIFSNESGKELNNVEEVEKEVEEVAEVEEVDEDIDEAVDEEVDKDVDDMDDRADNDICEADMDDRADKDAEGWWNEETEVQTCGDCNSAD
ncbi:unnamed protein product [Calypogeia fissa]